MRLLGNKSGISCFITLLAAALVLTFIPAVALSAAQGGQDPQDVSQEQIEEFKEVKKAAKKAKVAKAVKEDATGTDPRSFSNKWMPYYRYTELENELIQQDVTAFRTIGFSPRVGMFYEVPLAQYRDFSDVPGFPPGADSDAIGMGDMDLKFLFRPEALEFTYGKDGKMSGSVLLGTDFVLPTATDDALAGDAFLFAPIVAFVFDMPFYGFVAALKPLLL